jgi:hypothetical protein
MDLTVVLCRFWFDVFLLPFFSTDSPICNYFGLKRDSTTKLFCKKCGDQEKMPPPTMMLTRSYSQTSTKDFLYQSSGSCFLYSVIENLCCTLLRLIERYEKVLECKKKNFLFPYSHQQNHTHTHKIYPQKGCYCGRDWFG